jgi:S1-C subfamily serine protease
MAASVVVVRAAGAAGYGFYVREDLVLTTRQLVGATAVVDVTTADGATVPALVAALDPARDLALLQVPRPGPAAKLYQGRAPPPVRPPGAIAAGLPVLLDDQVVGMTAAAGAPGDGVVPLDAILAFLASNAALLAALP